MTNGTDDLLVIWKRQWRQHREIRAGVGLAGQRAHAHIAGLERSRNAKLIAELP